MSWLPSRKPIAVCTKHPSVASLLCTPGSQYATIIRHSYPLYYHSMSCKDIKKNANGIRTFPGHSRCLEDGCRDRYRNVGRDGARMVQQKTWELESSQLVRCLHGRLRCAGSLEVCNHRKFEARSCSA